MHSFTTFFAGAYLASLTLAKPVPQVPNKEEGFTVTGSVLKPLPAYPIRLANIFRKYDKPVPRHVAAAAAAASGSVVATPEHQDFAYLCPVTIGGQTLNLNFDTGSADLWVFSSEMPSSITSGHSIYDPSKSSTSKKVNGSSWEIQYYDGSRARGDIYTDNVKVGGITVKGQAVEAAQQVTASFVQDVNSDGLFGLGFGLPNSVSPQKQTTWFDSGIKQGVFQKNLFTADLKHAAPGTYDFGFIDKSKHTGSITYTPVNTTKGYWEITSTGYGVGNSFKRKSIDAIVDTGSTLILMDDSVVEDYYSKIDSAHVDPNIGGYVFPCNATIPNFVLGIGSGKSVVPASLMSLAPVGNGSCFGGLQSNGGGDFSSFGDVWLKSVLAVFDSENTRFGWAPKAV